MSTDHPLIEFYLGQGTDHKQRTIEAVWSLDSFWLEHTHDYIQWLFPIPEAGRFNGFAPLLTVPVRQAFAESPELQARQRCSLDIMLAFFGLERSAAGIAPSITATQALDPLRHIWLKRGGHNHLRISRMIRSLYLCHQPALAQAFQSAVIKIGTEQGYVSETSLLYWQNATQEA